MSRLYISLVLSIAATPALAQTPPGQGQAGLGGTAIPGVCFLSREAIFANAKIGVAAAARLKQISEAAQAEVTAERRPIDTEVQAFQAEAAKLTPTQRQAREQVLSPKVQAVQAKAQQRSQEIEATRAKAMEKISLEAQPVIAAVYKAKSCGLLLDRNMAIGGNLANDLTGAVVQGLDAKVSTITFDRATVPAAPTAAR